MFVDIQIYYLCIYIHTYIYIYILIYMERGIEVCFAGDPLDEMFIIVAGSPLPLSIYLCTHLSIYLSIYLFIYI